MKKIAYIIIALVIAGALATFAATDPVQNGQARLIDSTTTANTVYIGQAVVTENTQTNEVSTNSPIWSIKRIVTDASGNVSISEGYSTNSVQKKFSNKWSERATTNVIYKAGI